MIIWMVVAYFVVGVIVATWLGTGTDLNERTLAFACVAWPVVFLMMTYIFIGMLIHWLSGKLSKEKK